MVSLQRAEAELAREKPRSQKPGGNWIIDNSTLDELLIVRVVSKKIILLDVRWAYLEMNEIREIPKKYNTGYGPILSNFFDNSVWKFQKTSGQHLQQSERFKQITRMKNHGRHLRMYKIWKVLTASSIELSVFRRFLDWDRRRTIDCFRTTDLKHIVSIKN